MLNFIFSRKPILPVIIFLLSSTHINAITFDKYYVKEGGAGKKDGKSWANASDNLQAMINYALAGDSVFVAKGTYMPAANSSFILKEGVKIYGGFAGTETNLSQRDLAAGLVSRLMPNTGTITIINNAAVNLSAASVLDGFLLTGAPTNGISNGNSSNIIRNCVFTGNGQAGVSYTGALYISGGSPSIINCRFMGNKGGNGAAVISLGGNAVIMNSLFSGNTGGKGTGIYAINSTIKVINSTFSGNNGSSTIFTNMHSHTTLTNCIVYGNYILGIETENLPSLGSGVTTVTYSNIQGGHAGTGNINADPKFINAPNYSTAPFTHGDYRLQQGSPSIDTGTPSISGLNLPAADLIGMNRVYSGRIDMGAYEYPVYSYNSIYVDQSVAISGDGSTWAKAFKTLSDAFAAARQHSNIGAIYIAAGTYYPTGSSSSTNRDSAFIIPQRGGLKLYGGYPNGGGERDLFYQTILSGNIGANVTQNSYHVLVMANINAGADSVVIDGLTITGGYAGGTGQKAYNGQTTNRNEGGGILFYKNKNIGTKIAIRNCIIKRNTSLSNGAGIYLWETSPQIENTKIEYNQSYAHGGGIFAYEFNQPLIQNSMIENNKASKNGGAACFYTKNMAVIKNTLIRGNEASEFGGGLFFTDFSHSELTNSVVSGNASAQGSGIFNNSFSQSEIINCTIASNYTWGYNEEAAAAIVTRNDAYSRIINSIIYFNRGSDAPSDYSPTSIDHNLLTSGNGTAFITSCIIESSTAVWQSSFGSNYGGNLFQNPLFNQSNIPNSSYGYTNTGGDYSLQWSSPAIAFGNNSYFINLNNETKDLAGNQRLFGSRIDAGAYEYPYKAVRSISGFYDIYKNTLSPDFSLEAIADTYHTVNFSSSNPSLAEVYSYNLVRIKGGGTVNITAYLDEDEDYHPISVTRKLYISKVAPTISKFNDLTKTYGDAAFNLTAPISSSDGTFSYTSSNNSVAVASGGKVYLQGAGTAVITALQAETSIYSSGSISMTLKVNKGVPSLSGFNNITKYFGDDDFSLTSPLSTSDGSFTYSSSNVNTASVSGNVVSIKNPGTTTITAVQAETDNYVSNSISLTLTIAEKTLPVSLLHFTAKAENTRTRLIWATASEQNNKEFVIHRSGEDKQFAPIGTTAGAGSSKTGRTYIYHDENPLPGNNYYRLVQVDHDGEETRLGEKTINFKISAPSLKLYPNPTHSQIIVTFNDKRFTQMEIADLNGRVLQHIRLKGTENSKTVSLSDYPAGVYIIRLLGENYSESLKAIKL